MQFHLHALARTRRGDLPLRLAVANGFLARLGGLMFQPPLRANAAGTPGLLITACRSVHGCFLQAPLDVVFLCDRGRVVQIQRLQPFGAVRGRAGWQGVPRHVLELPMGSVARLGLLEGDWIVSANEPSARTPSVLKWSAA